MSMPSLADLRAFVLIAEHRSFTKAAGFMGVTRSSLSHTLRSLEESLGVRLLHRTTRSVSVTEAGERLLRRVIPLMKDFDLAFEELTDVHESTIGTLRINGNEAGIRYLIRSIVPRFQALYPKVELDLATEGRLVDIVDQGFDAGIRLSEAVPKDMVAVRLGPEVRFVPVASPSYLASHPMPMKPDDLLHHRCIRQRLPSGKRYRWEFYKSGEEIAVDVPGTLTLNNNSLMVDAAIQGVGIAFVPESYIRSALDAGELVTVLEEWCPVIPGLCLYFPQNRHMPMSLRRFVDLIYEERSSKAPT